VDCNWGMGLWTETGDGTVDWELDCGMEMWTVTGEWDCGLRLGNGTCVRGNGHILNRGHLDSIQTRAFMYNIYIYI
jgi:hypothetical protein